MQKSYLIATIILLVLTILDFVVPDVVPIVDEIILTLPTAVTGGVGLYKGNQEPIEAKSEMKDE